MATWHCGSRDCPTHQHPVHRCTSGAVWFCGCRQPQCPGHRNPDDQCLKGTRWHCGRLECPTHSGPDRCRDGVGPWFCGRKQSDCPGHASYLDRCEPGAADWNLYRRFSSSCASSIVQVLRSSAATQVSFNINQVKVGGYETIARVIDEGRILVILAPSLGSLSAYRYSGNIWGCGRPISSLGQKALAIHEATHALNDWHRRSLPAREDEAIAYIAQMLYSCVAGPTKLTKLMQQRINNAVLQCAGHSNRQFCEPAVIGLAFDIASTILNGKAVDMKLFRRLTQLIRLDPIYATDPLISHNHIRLYDGI
jgi:hypothetical protein